jgi:hypothetical protein
MPKITEHSSTITITLPFQEVQRTAEVVQAVEVAHPVEERRNLLRR